MASFNGNIGTPSGGFNLKVEYSISQSVSGNYSDVTATGYVKRNNSSYKPYNSSSSSSLTINGTAKSYTGSYDLRSDGYKSIVSNTVRVYHNNDGTKSITISFSFNGKLSSYYPNGSISQTITLPAIARFPVLTSGENFTDEGNPTLIFSNPAKIYPIRIKLEAGGNTQLITRDIDKSSTSYTFDLTEEERNKLRKLATTNSLTVTETVCAMNGSTELSASYKNYTMTIVNGNPIFNDFVFEDINEQTLALTGDNQSVIAGYSDVKVTIPLTNKAVAQKQATMSKYRFNSIDANYSDAEDVSIVSNKVTNGDFTVYAIDSRGNSTSKTKNALNVVNYTPLVKDSIVAQRQNGVSPTTTLKFNGKWWNGIFGQKPSSGQLRNIQIGDNLSGKKIYCTFDNEYQFYVLLEKVGTQNILKTDNSNLIQSFTEENDNGYEAFVITNGTNLYYGNSYTQEETNLPTYTLPDDFGIVTEINEYALAYGNIFVEDDNVTYEDVKNTIIAKYRYSLAGEENYFDGNTPIELVVDEENFSFEGLIAGDLGAEGFDISNAYNIQVIVDDELSQVVFTANLGSGTPHIAYAKNGVGIMGKYDESVGGLLQVGGKSITNSDSLPIGAIVEYDGDTIPDGYEEVEYYSTEETEIGTWIDGKPIYRRIVTASVPNSGNQVISFSGWNAENIILDHGKSYHKLTNNNTIGIDFYYNSNDWSRFYINSNGVYCHYGSGLTVKGNVTLFLEYTKTTD